MGIKEAALEYVEEGLSVIPIKPNNKKPYCSWAEYQNRLPTEDEIESWFEQWPNAQLALVTGNLSGVAVIDLDNQSAIEWAKNNLPRTGIFQKTRKGWHLFYQVNGNPVPNGVRITDGVDVRGDGGYVLIDPSMHPDGGKYELKIKPTFTWKNLPYFPKEHLPQQEQPERDPVTLDPAPEGERNNSIARIAGKYFAKGMIYSEVLAICKGWNADLKDPLSNNEVEKTVESIWKKDTTQQTQQTQQTQSTQNNSAELSRTQQYSAALPWQSSPRN